MSAPVLNRLVIGIVLVAVAAGAGAWLGTRARGARTAEQEDPALFVAPEHLQAGTVWDDEVLVMRLPIENRSDENVRIDGFSKSCDCEEITPEKVTIPAGQTRAVRVRIDLSRRPASALGENRFAVMVAPRSKSPPYHRGWSITGRVRPTLKVSPAFVDLGEVNLATADKAEGKLEVRLLSDRVERINTRTRNQSLQIKLRRVNANRVTLTLRPLNLSVPGLVRDTILIEPVRRDGTLGPARPVPVVYSVVGDYDTVPSSVFFGLRAGGEATEQVIVRSRNGLPFRIARVTVGDGSIKAAIDPLAKDRFALTQQFTKSGTSESRVTVVVEERKGVERRLVIPISYVGVESTGKK